MSSEHSARWPACRSTLATRAITACRTSCARGQAEAARLAVVELHRHGSGSFGSVRLLSRRPCAAAGDLGTAVEQIAGLFVYMLPRRPTATTRSKRSHENTKKHENTKTRDSNASLMTSVQGSLQPCWPGRVREKLGCPGRRFGRLLVKGVGERPSTRTKRLRRPRSARHHSRILPSRPREGC